MSKTDKTRPFEVQNVDPTMQRYKYVGNQAYTTDGTSDYFFIPINTDSCYVCGPKKYYKGAKRSARVRWKSNRQKALAYARSGDYDIDVVPERFRK